LLQCEWRRLPNVAQCLRRLLSTSVRSRTWESFAVDSSLPARTERRKDETDFEDVHRLGCQSVHIRVFRDHSACRSRRRLLHHQRRSSSAWLRLSEHGSMPGCIRRDRRHLRGRRQPSGQCPCVSTEAATRSTRASSQERIHRALIGRGEIRSESAAPEFELRGRNIAATPPKSEVDSSASPGCGARAPAAPRSRPRPASAAPSSRRSRLPQW